MHLYKLKLAAAAVLLLAFGMQATAQTKTKDDSYFEISKNLDIYYALFKEVNEYYVDPIQPGKMVKKSIDEMLNDLDPYTNYITEDDIEDYRFQTTGKYGGIGCAMRDMGEYIAIDELFEILTWKQLDLHEMPVSVFNINGYFDLQLKQIQHMVDEGFLKQPNMDALQVESDPVKLADWMMAYQPEKMEKKWIYVG
jgi:hypothetical protein